MNRYNLVWFEIDEMITRSLFRLKNPISFLVILHKMRIVRLALPDLCPTIFKIGLIDKICEVL